MSYNRDDNNSSVASQSLKQKVIPIVSICCLTYNHEEYIRDTIEGFLKQKVSFTYEIIIHDDASTDNTPVIVTEYVDKHPGVIVPIFQTANQYSLGIKPILKYVFPRARGKYIALCEGDDYWTDPYKLQKQVDFLEANPDYGLVHTDHATFNQFNHSYKQNIKKNLCESGYIFNRLLLKNEISTLTTMFRRSFLFNGSDIDKNLKIKNWAMLDYPLWLQISKISKIKFLNEATAVYRIHDNSVSNRSNYKRKMEFLNSTFEIKKYFLFTDEYYSKALFAKISSILAMELFLLAVQFNREEDINKYYQNLKNYKYTIKEIAGLKLRFIFYKLGLFAPSRRFKKLISNYLKIIIIK